MQNNQTVEKHPLPPFFPAGARLLMLGSFPPARKRWKMEFYYPNLQNDMWRIFGLVFFRDRDYFLTADRREFREERIREFLTEKGIAISDTAGEVIRQKGTASDKFLQVVKTIPLEEVLTELPDCRFLVTTGEKATDILSELTGAGAPPVGGYTDLCYRERPLRLYRMPSSSRAYPKPLEEKAAVYAEMFRQTGIFTF
ncbi:MAG: uracil-DNA glycosylase family protein [Culturomica sp.]|jgi:G:T/U-mismatch repair DNA glycosylase|nr:uracil-DNA glycosylase family protein [Culturomica sp.]